MDRLRCSETNLGSVIIDCHSLDTDLKRKRDFTGNLERTSTTIS